MLHPITMPKLGLTMESGIVTEWRKREGEWVEQGAPLLEVETEKITYEVEAEAAGFLHIMVATQIEVPVAAELGYLAATRESYDGLLAGRGGGAGGNGGAGAAASGPAGPERTPAVAAAPPPSSADGTATPPPGGGLPIAPGGRRIQITPLARKMVQEMGLPLELIQGTGPGGAIRSRDVLATAGKRSPTPAAAILPAQPAPAAPPGTGGATKRVKEQVPLSGARRVIARRMQASLQQSAQLTAFGRIDMAELRRVRTGLVAEEERHGVRISYSDLFVRALAVVLKEMPVFNASIEGDQVIHWEDINIGLAVDVQDGLIVPVLHGADALSLLEIARRRKELVDKARRHALAPADIEGGTFTLTNFGSYGGDMETAILNPPEVAIMGVGVIQEEAVVIDGAIQIRPTIHFSFTTDHRLIDGATSGRFRMRFRELIERPELLLLY
jgi:pyruvate/2-oxoglutarate dehydrogenase complex dihydrolipoamide acyltransferase (E2) component